jgi:Concanavalin A-like lectin/glucanases superfamily/Bacterial Ig domain
MLMSSCASHRRQVNAVISRRIPTPVQSDGSARGRASLLMSAVLLISVCFTPARAQTAGPLAAYSFTEGSGTVLSDVSGHGITMDLTNGPAWVAGHYGTALSFDGSNDRAVARAYNAALNLAGRSFTLSAWINPRSNSSWQMIVLKPASAGHNSPYFDWSMHREISTGRIVGYLGCDGGQRTSNASTALNAWTHVAVTYDGTALRHYINGVLDRTTALTCAVTNTSSQPIRIGANGGNGEVLNGSVDDVRIYDRVLSAAEIQADMNTALGGGSPSSSPDTSAPVVSVSAPANGATVSGTVAVAANASDNVGVAGVQFRLDGANLGAEDQSAPYSIAWSSTAASNGSHVLTAVARDAAGNVATAGADTVTVANAAPTPTLGVTLSATPTSGNAPLNGVDLTTSVSGTATGTTTYTFYCNRSDTGTSVSQPWDLQVTNSSQTTLPAADVCNYDIPGSYTAKVIAQRAALAAEARTSVSVSAPPPTPVQLLLTANPTSVASSGTSNITWSSVNATSCTASGAWSGAQPTSGSASTGPLFAASNTFTLTCSAAGSSVSSSATVGVEGAVAETGLDFQGSASTDGTVRFKFTNPLAIYPATYIWRVFPRQQSSYYTTFFWGNDDGSGNLDSFQWDNGNSNTFYGAHPYPNFPDPDTHHWEIATDHGGDFVSSQLVVYNRWYTQALVAWSDGDGKKHTVFYWDLPDTSRTVEHMTDPSYGNTNPPAPALTWGDAPWNPSNEIMNGVIRGIQIYSVDLSISNVLGEVATPLSTSAGASNIWYMNLNPTPTDISDKSGAGHNPAWVGSGRALPWSGQ